VRVEVVVVWYEGWHRGNGESAWEGQCKGESVSKEEKRLCNE